MVKRAYFIGIAGIAMSSLALAFRKSGWEVSGSDQKEIYPPVSVFLEENQIPCFKGYRGDNLSFIPDLVVVGRSALITDPDNPEYIKAKKLDCRILSYPEVIRDCLIRKNSVVVAGTYGKSTTTALISWILARWGVDPSFMIGGIPLNFGEGTRITNSDYSVVEGDETPSLQADDPPKFMFYQPKYLLLTATRFDHPEIYETKEEYLDAYAKLVKLLPKEGVLFYDPVRVDDKIVKSCKSRKITYLTETEIRLDEAIKESGLRAITLCKELKIPSGIVAEAISTFKGLKARREFLGKFGGKYFYQDSSQHPSKIKSCLMVLKRQYPENKITVVFNPSATSLKYKEVLNDYSEAFSDVEQVILAKVDYLGGISGEKRVTGPDLIKAFGGEGKIVYEPIYENIVERLRLESKEGDVIVFMSSGGLKFTSLIENTINELKD